ncbi:MAG: glycosyltransferase family 39 protein, partial [Hyphomicrobium sp.]
MPAADKLLLTVALALTVVRLIIAGHTGLVDDEAYYRMWSLAPALSYLDHPPMVAWVIGAGRALAGDSALGVRLLAPLIVLAGAAVLWRTAFLLYGPTIASRAVWLMLAMPLLAVGGIIV